LTYGVLLPLFGAPAGISGFGAYINLDKTTQEFRLASKPSDRFEWLVGGFYDNEESTQNQIVSANNFDGTPVIGLDPLAFAGLPSTYREYAVFGDVTYKFTSAFDVSAGGRWARNNQTFSQVSGGSILPTATVPGSSAQGVWTYSASPRFHITPDSMVYVRVATGYQPGGPNVFLPGVPPSVDADTLTNYELGFKSLLADRRVMIDVDAFLIDWHKIQVSATNGVASYIVNGGTARSDGFELATLFKPLDRLQLGFNAAFTNAKLTQNVPSISGESGDRLPYIPRWAASTTADYSIPLSAQWTARVGGGVHYTGGSETAVTHSPFALPLASNTGVDLHTDVENDHWTVRLFVKNAGNNTSYVNEAPIVSALTQAVVQVRGVPLQPRTVGLSIDAKF
jgi:outer membrane receptor protein involved in Fe transport